MSQIINHTLEPFVFPETRVLILGTMPSPKSRETGFYYGHPSNRFWKVMSKLFNVELNSIEDKKIFLRNERIGLWDVLKRCEITGASDASIKSPEANDIEGILKTTQIGEIFTTGKTAHSLLLKLTGIDSVCLPSPSPANCAISFDKLLEAYSAVKSFLCQT